MTEEKQSLMTQPAIVMYATASCPFCGAARQLFHAKDLTWTEVSLDTEPDKRAEMISRTGRRTVPQIFIGDTHVGGFDDLAALDEEGALDRLLGVTS
jgi:glutaredoxin 3